MKAFTFVALQTVSVVTFPENLLYGVPANEKQTFHTAASSRSNHLTGKLEICQGQMEESGRAAGDRLHTSILWPGERSDHGWSLNDGKR